MEMKSTIRAIQIAIADAEWPAGQAVDEMYLPQIEEAKALLFQMRGTDVIKAVAHLRRCGLSLAVDLKPVKAAVVDKADQGPFTRKFR